MPLYTFFCDSCGVFEQWRAMADFNQPVCCPQCQKQGRRFFSSSGTKLSNNPSSSQGNLNMKNTQQAGQNTKQQSFQSNIEKSDFLESTYEHLLFVERLIVRTDILQSIKVDLQQSIERIKKRYSDPNLYLAVVGEFSSGKSTFINALLRDDLLKTSALVTTATATHLSYGSDLTVEVRLQGAKTGVLRTQPESKKITVPWLPGIKDLDNRQFIHALTSQNEIAQCITSLTITHPSSFLANQITIIDTPGTNANSQHESITKQVLKSEADAAIIIIPANIPLSQTLINFLSGSLHPFLHRCMFVVTRMDQIREREQSRLLNNLRSRLVEQLGIEPPLLYTCSAQVSLDLLTGEEPVRDDLKIWGERFANLENIIIDRLHRERSLSITESILRLLTQLFEQIEYHLKAQWDDYQTNQTLIQNETIPDLTAFASKHHVICHQMLEDVALPVRLQVNKYIEKHQNSLASKLKKAIFEAENEASLKAVIENEAQSISDKEQQALRQDIQNSTRKLSQAVEAASQYFDKEFSTIYHKLIALTGRAAIKSTISAGIFQIDISNILSDTQSLNQKIEYQDLAGMILGSAGFGLGVSIGTAILPIIGTAVGGILGMALGGFLITSLDERKKQIWDKIMPSLDDYFYQVSQQSQAAVEQYKQNSMVALDKRRDDYISSYKEAVEILLAEQKSQLNRLNELQHSIQIDLLEIAERKKSLRGCLETQRGIWEYRKALEDLG
jgi:putative FmdB family regulatory protein